MTSFMMIFYMYIAFYRLIYIDHDISIVDKSRVLKGIQYKKRYVCETPIPLVATKSKKAIFRIEIYVMVPKCHLKEFQQFLYNIHDSKVMAKLKGVFG